MKKNQSGTIVYILSISGAYLSGAFLVAINTNLLVSLGVMLMITAGLLTTRN